LSADTRIEGPHVSDRIARMSNYVFMGDKQASWF